MKSVPTTVRCSPRHIIYSLTSINSNIRHNYTNRIYNRHFIPSILHHQDYGQIAQRPLRLPPSFGKNQHIPIDGDVKEQLKKVLLHFDAPIQYALAYGSGVFPQKGYDSKVKISLLSRCLIQVNFITLAKILI